MEPVVAQFDQVTDPIVALLPTNVTIPHQFHVEDKAAAVAAAAATAIPDSTVEYDYYGDLDVGNPMDDPTLRVVFILLYVTVFAACFIGNVLVVLVILLHRQMRSITNFFLANLSVADFCVGVFCVLPNLWTYLYGNWIFGQVMCKLSYFVQATSYTASICILTVISIERYVAIIYPIHIRRLHSLCLLRSTVACIWTIAALSGTPYLVFYDVIVTGRPQETDDSGNATSTPDLATEMVNVTATSTQTPEPFGNVFCIRVHEFNESAYNAISFILWYAVPLALMTFVYLRISVVLWRSSLLAAGDCRRSSSRPRGRARDSVVVSGGGGGGGEIMSECDVTVQIERTRRHSATTSSWPKPKLSLSEQMSQSTGNVVTSRRRVIRLLIAVVVSFAFCVLPYHVRLLWQAFGTPQLTYWQQLLRPSTFLVYYLNSALNPALYAFLSDKFRKCLIDLLVRRRCRGNQYVAGGGGAGGMHTVASYHHQTVTLKTFNVNSTPVTCTAAAKTGTETVVE